MGISTTLPTIIMIAASRTTARRLVQQSFAQTRNIQLAAKASSAQEVSRVFERFDVDRSNALCLDELKNGFKSVGAPLSSEELGSMLKQYNNATDLSVDPALHIE